MAPRLPSTVRVAACAALLLVVSAVSCSARPLSVPGWDNLGRAPDAARVSLLFAVRHGVPTAVLEQKCLSVSDPDSAAYGQYMSLAELSGFLQAGGNAAVVQDWLRSTGLSQGMFTVHSNDFIGVTAPVSTVNAVFNVTMHVFRSQSTGRVLTRSPTPHTLPRHVDAAVDTVVGLSEFIDPIHLGANRFVRPSPEDVAAAAAAAAADDDFGPAPAFLSAIVPTDTTLYCFFDLLGSGLDKLNVEIDMVVDGVNNYTVVVPGSSATPASFGGGADSLWVVSTTQHMQGGSAYNISIRTVDPSTHAASPYSYLPFHRSELPASYKGVVASAAISPQVFEATYGIMPATATAGASQAVAEFGGEYMNVTDFETYLARFNISSPSVVFHGPNNQTTPGMEAQMDIELIQGLAPNAQSTFWSLGGDSFILDWAMQMSNATNPPLVTSISYATPESTLPSDYFSRCNTELMKLCARGLSVVTGAGDAGASNFGHGSAKCGLTPMYPASSPFITTTSATYPTPVAAKRLNGQLGEIAISVQGGSFWTTGGGFSNQAASRQPEYQSKVVTHYLNTAKLPSLTFNKTGRAYPDISAIGTNYWMTIEGETYPLGAGTSSSTPTFSAILTRLNDARMHAGLPPVGFVNPLLYKLAATTPQAFYDVTIGNNRCGEFLCCPQGFEATEGWDAVTGLGTVGDYGALQAAVLDAATAVRA